MQVEIEPLLPLDADVLARLMQLYVYDFSEVTGADVDARGAFAIGEIERSFGRRSNRF